MSRAALAATLLALAACSTSSARLGPIPYGNPAGYRVHVLQGADLSAREVSVNGLTVDATSVETIDASVAALVADDGAVHAPTTVAEAAGESPDLTADFTGAATPVPATFHGADLQWRSKFFLRDARFRALVRHARIDLLRFPGGQERVKYDGADPTFGTDPAADTYPAGGTYEFRMSAGDVAAYADLCAQLGVHAMPEVNVTVRDVDREKAFVKQLADALGDELEYVSVGNEPDVKSPNDNWPFLGATSGSDAEKRTTALRAYAERYLAYRAALDPVRPGLTYALGELADGRYLGEVLGHIGPDQPGAVSFHWYMTGDYGQRSDSPDYPSIDHLSARAIWDGPWRNGQGLPGQVAAARAAAGAAGLAAPKLFIGEFGAAWSATPAAGAVVDRLAAALFAAEAQETGKAAGVDAMLWFGLSDPASFGADPEHPWVPSLIAVDDAATPWAFTLRPQYYVSLLYRELYGRETVPVPGGQEPDFSLYAARDGERSYLLLINRTADRRVSRVVKAKTAAGERLLRLTSYPHSLAVVEF